MSLRLALLFTATIMATSSAFAADLVKKVSPYSAAVTIDRLADAVTGAGGKVFARVNHAAGAASIGEELAPTELIIFGSPKIGTPVIQANQEAGLDLPLRAVAYEAADGQTYLVYHNPKRLVDDHGIASDMKAIQMMTGALNKLTDKAISK